MAFDFMHFIMKYLSVFPEIDLEFLSKETITENVIIFHNTPLTTTYIFHHTQQPF